MRRSRLIGLVVALLMSIPVSAAAESSYPDVISLPGGFFPEGIAVGDGHTVYVGSLADGSIWSGDLRTGEGEVVVIRRGRIRTLHPFKAAARETFCIFEYIYFARPTSTTVPPAPPSPRSS